MTKSPLPWSLKGVSLEARARAKLAAGEAGEPLGKWLGDTIRQVAEAEAAKTAPHAVEPAPSPEPPRPNPEIVAEQQTVVPEPLPAPVNAAPIAAHLSAIDGGKSLSDGDSLAIPSAPQSTSDMPRPRASAIEGPAPDALSSPQKAAADDTHAEPSVSHVPEDWRTAFADLARRLDESERRLTASVAPLQVAVERVLSRLDRDQQRPKRGWRLRGFGRFRDDR